MPKVPEPWKLARELCIVLNDWLTPEQIAEANELNAAETNSSVCHSHDYCDANMAMHKACCTWEDPLTTGVPDTDNALMSEAWHNCWDAAWTLAKDAGFDKDHVRIEQGGLKQYKAVLTSGVRYSVGGSTREYSDWFPNDEIAKLGFAQMMQEQGYGVTSVEIGFPCVVTLE